LRRNQLVNLNHTDGNWQTRKSSAEEFVCSVQLNLRLMAAREVRYRDSVSNASLVFDKLLNARLQFGPLLRNSLSRALSSGIA